VKRFLLVLLLILEVSLRSSPADAQTESSTVTFFRPCVAQESSCIESIFAQLPSGKMIQGMTSTRLESTPLSDKDSYLKLLKGPVDEWKFPGLTFQNGTDRIVLYSYYWPAGYTHCWNDGNCSINEEELGIYLRPSNKDGMRPPVMLTGNDALKVCPNSPSNCNIGSPPWMIDMDVVFKISLRTPIEFEPQYTHGRIQNLLVTSDAPGDLPYKRVLVTFSPLKLQNVYFALPDPGVLDQSIYVTDEPALWIYGARNSKSISMGQCIKYGGLQVTSNAYYMWNPTWNPNTKSIDVRLQSTHYDLDGKPSKGLLQVRVSTIMAQCLWAVDLTGNIKAEFSITYEDGSKPEVISILGNIKDDHFDLTAANFHFSSPIVKMKLIEVTGPKITATPSPSPSAKATDSAKVTPASPTKTTISCAKGKIIKKVTAVAPKCPTGYKKK